MSPLLNEATLDDILEELNHRFGDIVLAGIASFEFSPYCSEGDAFFFVNGKETQRRGLISMLDDYNRDHEFASMEDLTDYDDEDEDNLAFGL